MGPIIFPTTRPNYSENNKSWPKRSVEMFTFNNNSETPIVHHHYNEHWVHTVNETLVSIATKANAVFSFKGCLCAVFIFLFTFFFFKFSVASIPTKNSIRMFKFRFRNFFSEKINKIETRISTKFFSNKYRT